MPTQIQNKSETHRQGSDSAGREITLRSVDWDRPAEAPSGANGRGDERVSFGQLTDSLMSYRIESTKPADSRDVLVSAVRRSPTNTEAPEESNAEQSMTFRLSLRPEQLARLWLREPSLKPSNVLVWSEREQNWVPALKIPEVAAQITRARIESVRMWSVLCASRVSTGVTPPQKRTRMMLTRLSAFAQILTNRSRRFPVRSLRVVPNAARSPIGKAYVRSSRAYQTWFFEPLLRLCSRLVHWGDRLMHRAHRRAKRNAILVSLFTYFSISSVVSGIVVSRLIELRQHDAKAHGANVTQQHPTSDGANSRATR